MSSRKTLANAIRVLSMDAVQKANSGHPGAPMGMADIAEVLYNDFMRHNPANPEWSNRDRFIMSNGHGSMLPYSVLHLSGSEVTIEDFNIVDHFTYVFLGDGCMMEGISHEACSLAGTLGLGKLIAFWDDNGISIDGHVEGWFTDDTPGRFESYGWHVVAGVDGHDPDAISKAIEEAKSVSDKPSMICCKTTIGFGSPNKAGGHDCHGAPLGDDEIALTRKELGWTAAPFEIPEDVYAGWDHKEQGAKDEAAWNEKFAAYKAAFPAEAAEFE